MGRGVWVPAFAGTTRSDVIARKLSPGCRAALLFAIQQTDDLIRVSRHRAVMEIS
jgi:hypothetical protein